MLPCLGVISTVIKGHLSIFVNINFGPDNPALSIDLTIWICTMIHIMPVKAMTVRNDPDITARVFELEDVALSFCRRLPF